MRNKAKTAMRAEKLELPSTYPRKGKQMSNLLHYYAELLYYCFRLFSTMFTFSYLNVFQKTTY